MHRHALAALILLVLIPDPSSGQERGVGKLIDFGPALPGDWYVVNDGVMGGRSQSGLEYGSDGIGVFAGYLSLENNGGFASVRSVIPEGAMANAARVVLRVRGDGKRYQLRLRGGRRFDGVAFAASFETVAEEWTTIDLPIESFRPTYRGYAPRGVGPFDPATVGQVGLMLTDKQTGPFRLEIDWIGLSWEGS